MSAPIHVAIGPELPKFGSWMWLGAGLEKSLGNSFRTTVFADVLRPPKADVIVFLKFKPPPRCLAELHNQNCRLVFLPVDVYGSVAEIDGDLDSLRLFDLVVVHSQRLKRYFNTVSQVEYVDHPLNFALDVPRTGWQAGPCLWIGKQCNITPIVEWANRRLGKAELWVLTDTSPNTRLEDFGFCNTSRMRLAQWSESIHMEWLNLASVAIDIKGSDFRSRHKPPAKTFDFLASGLPVLTNKGSSVAIEMLDQGMTPLYEHGREVDEPISSEYIVQCTSVVRNIASPTVVWNRMQVILRSLHIR